MNIDFYYHLKDLAEQHKENVVKYNIQDFCFDKQIEFIESKSRYKTARCSRRAGKSTGLAHYLRETATKSHGHDCLYITKTRVSAKRIIWQMLKDIIRQYNDNTKINESELTIYFKDTNSRIFLSGANDSAQIEKLRGQKYKLVVIDEAQIFGSYVKYLVEEIIEPALADLQGTLCVTGTPNAACAGWFYDIDNNDYWSHFNWTWKENKFFLESALKENPNIHTPDDILDDVCRRRGVNLADPAIQREWLGNWVKSDDLMVYKYDANINSYHALPHHQFKYVLGCDLGFNDSDALVVIAYTDASRECYVVEEVKKNKLSISQLASEITILKQKYNPYYSVIDAGALGKKIQEELNQRFSFNFDAADKNRKAEFVELVNSDLRLGYVKIKNNSELSKEMSMLCWDNDEFEEGKFIEDGYFDNHLCDAFLYAWRYLYNYCWKEIVKKPLLSFNEMSIQKEQDHEERLIEKIKERQSEGWNLNGNWE